METNILYEYLELIEKGLDDVGSNELFKAILEQSEYVLLLTDSDLAFEMQMTRPTINRWRSGANAPLVPMRKNIYNKLKRRTNLMIKKSVEANAQTVAVKAKASAKEAESPNS